MHLLEEGEREDEDVDGMYNPEEFDPEEENVEEYNPHKPDLELQYLVNKANLMEQKKELTKEEDTHAYCNYCKGCSDWSTCLPGANKWKSGSPNHDNDDWQPQSPDKAYLKTLCHWASSTTPPLGLR
jgi:hypothetical protein